MGYFGLGLAGGTTLGFMGGASSSALLQTLNGQTIDTDEVLTSGAIYSFMGMGAGILGGYVAIIGAEQVVGAGAYSALAGTVAIVGEAVIDGVSVIIEEVREYFDSEEE